MSEPELMIDEDGYMKCERCEGEGYEPKNFEIQFFCKDCNTNGKILWIDKLMGNSSSIQSYTKYNKISYHNKRVIIEILELYLEKRSHVDCNLNNSIGFFGDSVKFSFGDYVYTIARQKRTEWRFLEGGLVGHTEYERTWRDCLRRVWQFWRS
jgi:hypothetical protein